MPAIEFGQRGVANEIRNRLDGFLAEDDSRVEKTVRLQERVPDSLVQRVQEEAADSREADAQKAGQASLSDRERREIDFSKDGVDVPTARSIKGIADREGVTDWLQFADLTLTVDENRRVLERAGREERGARGRGKTQEQAALEKGKQAKRRRRQQAEGAKDAAFAGDSEAIGFLREEERFEDDLFDVSLRGSGPSGRDYERLQDAHDARSERARRVDERRSSTVTRDPLRWAGAKNQLDYPGIDTVDPASLHAERSLNARQIDEREQAPIADTREQWARNPDRYDWRGVDTKRRPTMDEIRQRAETMRDAKNEALYQEPPMTPDDEIMARASARDVSLDPDEALQGVGAVGTSALGGFSSFAGGERSPSVEFETPPDIARGEDPFELDDAGDAGGSPLMADDRDQQASLDVGMAAGTTADREGQLAGSADFADRRDELRPDADMGDQAGLFEVETEDDGQTDLFGDTASTTTGAEYLK